MKALQEVALGLFDDRLRRCVADAVGQGKRRNRREVAKRLQRWLAW